MAGQQRVAFTSEMPVRARWASPGHGAAGELGCASSYLTVCGVRAEPGAGRALPKEGEMNWRSCLHTAALRPSFVLGLLSHLQFLGTDVGTKPLEQPTQPTWEMQ